MFLRGDPGDRRELWSTLGLDALALVWSLDVDALRALDEPERHALLQLTRRWRDDGSLAPTGERLRPLSEEERLRRLLALAGLP